MKNKTIFQLIANVPTRTRGDERFHVNLSAAACRSGGEAEKRREAGQEETQGRGAHLSRRRRSRSAGRSEAEQEASSSFMVPQQQLDTPALLQHLVKQTQLMSRHDPIASYWQILIADSFLPTQRCGLHRLSGERRRTSPA